jgi:hypothetical protein
MEGSIEYLCSEDAGRLLSNPANVGEPLCNRIALTALSWVSAFARIARQSLKSDCRLATNRPELQYPSLHRLVGDIQAALREQILDVAIAPVDRQLSGSIGIDRLVVIAVGRRDSAADSRLQTVLASGV